MTLSCPQVLFIFTALPIIKLPIIFIPKSCVVFWWLLDIHLMCHYIPQSKASSWSIVLTAMQNKLMTTLYGLEVLFDHISLVPMSFFFFFARETLWHVSVILSLVCQIYYTWLTCSSGLQSSFSARSNMSSVIFAEVCRCIGRRRRGL